MKIVLLSICGVLLLIWCASMPIALTATPAQSLGISKKDSFGQPIDVGLLILGHSTSAVGDYPAKLAQALNADANDGRNYVVFRVITSGDGGFLWTQLSFQPNDTQYARVQTSQSPQQWCQDNAGVRWSCRRARLEEGLTGVKPPTCFGGDACSPPATISLSWHEGGVKQAGTLSFHEAWKKMDVRLALIQDTTNRSWPVDDFNSDGAVDEKDYWPESRITAAARPCGGTGGVVTGSGGARFIDWNCDGQLTAADAAANRYAGWMEKLAQDLLNNFPADSRAHHVFITQKPIELICNSQFFPGEQCRNHLPPRAPTASRPYDHFYLPTVYWEYRMIETLFARNNLDSRIHKLTADARRMWDRSVQGYTQGIKASDWAIPASGGRPNTDIAADDTENDADMANAQSVGTVLADHVHHTNNGGWMMANVWYAGLQSYLNPAATVASVSAASYSGATLAPESIVAAFGSNLATATTIATTTPLPTSLAGTSVKVRDSASVERLAPLFFVSPTQINYQIPPATANGVATMTITSGDGSVSTGSAQIASVAPGLFAADASGRGLAAAVVFRVKADGSQSYEPVAQFDAAQGKFVALPIDLGPETDQVVLILFGTGLRYRSALSTVSAKLGDPNEVDAQVMFAGAQDGFVGLDQVNVRLSRNLIGRGDVDIALTVDAQAANTVKVAFAGQHQIAAFECTQVIGFSQTNQWYSAGFESAVDNSRWQLLWNSGASINRWADPNYEGWSRSLVSPCSQGQGSPDRVLLTISGDFQSDPNRWAQQINAVIAVIRDKYPRVRQIILQPVVGGPNNGPCQFNDQVVRASSNHPVIDAAIALVASGSVAAGLSPEVRTCADYSDAIGHLAPAATGPIGASIGQFYATFNP